MEKDECRDFAQVVHHHAGDTFRSVFRYTDDDWTALYVRDDVATDDLQSVISTLIQRLREQEPVIQEEYGRLGETRATVELHEDGVLLHFRETETDGVAVSLDREAAQELSTFIDQCQAALPDS